MRSRLRWSLALMLIAGAGIGWWSDRSRTPAPAAAQVKMVEELDLRNVPLRKAIEEIARRGNVEIVADWSDIGQLPEEDRPPVTLRLKHVSVQLAARLALEYSLSWPGLDAKMDGNRLVIHRPMPVSSYPWPYFVDFDEPSITRTYDVGFILRKEAAIRRSVGAKDADLSMSSFDRLIHVNGRSELIGDFYVLTAAPPHHRQLGDLLEAWRTSKPVDGGKP